LIGGCGHSSDKATTGVITVTASDTTCTVTKQEFAADAGVPDRHVVPSVSRDLGVSHQRARRAGQVGAVITAR